jgi:hypothetical protein
LVDFLGLLDLIGLLLHLNLLNSLGVGNLGNSALSLVDFLGLLDLIGLLLPELSSQSWGGTSSREICPFIG